MHSQDLPNEKVQDLWGLRDQITCCTDLLVTLGLCFCTATACNGSLAVVLHVIEKRSIYSDCGRRGVLAFT